MIFPINIETWKERYEKFRSIDYAASYYDFWKWKVGVEQSGASILDDSHRNEAFEMLTARVGRWKVYRPLGGELCLPRLEKALESIQTPYSIVRKFNLLSFDKIPRDQLKIIWNKFGAIKVVDGNENPTSCYLTVATTKPMMFVWGQTLAFDSYVRKVIRNISRADIGSETWTFTMWYNAMEQFQQWLLEQPDFISLLKSRAREDFGSDDLVPYGQFIDLYYWLAVRDKKSAASQVYQ